MSSDVEKVKRNIAEIYNRKRAVAVAICYEFAQRMIQDFRAAQEANKYWKNQSNQAKDKMFTKPINEKVEIGIRMAHGVAYGVYLELANNRQNEAIRPTIIKFLQPFLNALRGIYSVQ